MAFSVCKSVDSFIFVFICCWTVNQIAATTVYDNYAKFRQARNCSPSTLRCDSGECIPEENLCDGIVHCKDGSDETRDCVNIKPCASKFLFQCDYGACINKVKQCDGKQDCRDNSDENEIACSKCGTKQFKCHSGNYIDETLLCDGKADCYDNSDESSHECFNFYCPQYAFRCKYGACISKKFECNGINDCIDGSDEDHCNITKSPILGKMKYKCSSGDQCINEERICDGVADCHDSSDETSELCSQFRCSSRFFRCKYGACVQASARCNGVVECVDASDEAGCFVDKTYATSILKPKCIRNEFKCSSGECISEKDICNGRKDCLDGSDETFDYCAFRRCPFGSYTCKYGGCIQESKRCDGVVDCWDISDELDCFPATEKVTLKPSVPSIDSCTMPTNPRNGKYQIAKHGDEYGSGDQVPSFSVLLTKCNDGYIATPASSSTLSVCFAGSWSPTLFKCTRTCAAFISTGHTECTFDNKPLQSCENAIEGTIALTRCANVDENSDTPSSLVQICRNGAWDKFPLNRDISSTSTNGTVINIFYLSKNKKR